MESIVKGFLGTLFMAIIVCLGHGMLSASIEARNADSFAADCVKRIECSNYSDDVISGCITDAGRLGYGLSVDAYAPADSSRREYGELTLVYRYRLPILNIEEERHIHSDMR